MCTYIILYQGNQRVGRLCRDDADTTRWLRTPKRSSYKPFQIQTLFLYSLRPSKYVYLYNSVKLAYRKRGTSTLLGFYMKQLLSLACVILDQETLCYFTRKRINREPVGSICACAFHIS